MKIQLAFFLVISREREKACWLENNTLKPKTRNIFLSALTIYCNFFSVMQQRWLTRKNYQMSLLCCDVLCDLLACIIHHCSDFQLLSNDSIKISLKHTLCYSSSSVFPRHLKTSDCLMEDFKPIPIPWTKSPYLFTEILLFLTWVGHVLV